MKKIEYKCNLCSEIKKPTELTCMYWGWNDKKEGWILSDKVDNSDIHLCDNCITLIKSK